MAIEVFRCPNCAAPIPAGARGEVVCMYCKHALHNVPGAKGPRWTGPERGPDDGLPRVRVGQRVYALLDKIAEGHSSDVFRARRDERLTELVVLKALRANADADLLAREWSALEALHAAEVQGSDYFPRLLPQLVARGPLKGGDAAERPAVVYRWRSGFVHTLGDVLDAHPNGVDPKAAIWMWKRMLEFLGWVHRTGHSHGSVTPSHVLVHPRDHGVVLAGWSTAGRGGKLPAVVAGARDFYPDEAWTGRLASPSTDLVMTARCIAYVLGGEAARGTVSYGVPEPVAGLVSHYATMAPAACTEDAWAMIERVSEAGRAAFGPPKFVPFKMPGW